MSEEVIREWQELFDAKQTVRKFRNALAGNGGGTVDVTGEPGYIWCRYSADQSKVSKVFNIIAPGLPEDFPIVVGRRFPTDEFEQVLAVNWTLYQDIISQDTVDNFTTGNHGESHNAASGADPAPIDLRNIVEMRGRAQATANLTINVERGQYVFGYDDVRRFPGEMIDLTAAVPGVAGHRLVLVYVDGVTNALGSVNGAIVPLANAAPIPDITANIIPVCLVDLENGQTTITEDDIYDWRFLWDLVSWNAPWLIGTAAERGALVVGDLAELTHFAETDTDQVWQVWEGAWRIAYPPPALSAPDGSPDRVWAVANDGDLLGDDGVGDSPHIELIDGDDTQAEIWYSATSSTLYLKTPDAVTIRSTADVDGISLYRTGVGQFMSKTALTNLPATPLRREHTTSGVAAAGFGLRDRWSLENAGGALEEAATLEVIWDDPAAASEDSRIVLSHRKAGAAISEAWRLDANGVLLPDAYDMFPNDDGRGFAARFVNPPGLAAWTAHFRPGETTGPGNGTLTGYAWQGAPLGGTPATATYNFANDYLRLVDANKCFLSKAVTNAAASWQNKSLYARPAAALTVEIGMRLDAGDDNNWVELYFTGAAGDATQTLEFRYRDNGGAINTVASNVVIPAGQFLTIRLLCSYSAPNYTAVGLLIGEDVSNINVTGFAHQLNGNWAVGPPTAGRAGVFVDNSGNAGIIDWFYNEFT